LLAAASKNGAAAFFVFGGEQAITQALTTLGALSFGHVASLGVHRLLAGATALISE